MLRTSFVGFVSLLHFGCFGCLSFDFVGLVITAMGGVAFRVVHWGCFLTVFVGIPFGF